MKKKKKKNNNFFTRIIIFFLTIFFLLMSASTIYRFTKETKKIPGVMGEINMRVEVINGCGVNELAYKVSFFLREKGFDVVDISNVTGSKVERTIIIERVDKGMKNAKVLGRAIGCSNMTTMLDSTLFLEATLLLGKDYEGYFNKEVLEKRVY